LECYGITEESIDKNTYLGIFRGLHSDDLSKKEAAFKRLDGLYK
jgi:hypothetical protein